MTDSPQYWCVVPAAGVGKRMAAQQPKQYLELLGKTVCEHTLARLLAVPDITEIVVCLNPEDTRWPELPYADHPRITPVEGGGERCDSVLNGIHHVARFANPDDWVLVHDVARPCVRLNDITRLIQEARASEWGGILATPVTDTLKRARPVSNCDRSDAPVIAETLSREQLWQALTPQMFRVGQLQAALTQALAAGVVITDEASAIEWAGGTPLLVSGHSDNIKITRPGDLALAALFLQHSEDLV